MSAVPIEVPRVNANDDDVEFLKRHVEDGARVEPGATVADLGTSKAAIGVESPAAGTVVFLYDEGATIAVGAAFAMVCATADDAAAARARRSELAANSHGAAPRAIEGAAPKATAPRLSRAAQAFLARQGVDSAAIPGGGLVTARRARRHALAATRVETDWVKRAEIQALTRSAVAIASSVTTHAFVPDPAGASALPAIICAAARLFEQYPALNGCFEDGATLRYDAVHIGVAMDLGRGLRVLTIRDAAARSREDVERALEDFTLRYLDVALRPEDMADATFTITDLSGFGVASFQPRINDGQAAILGIGAGPEPGAISLTLVFDHRVTNGRTAAMFLSDLRDAIGGRDAAPAGAQAGTLAIDAAACDRCGIDLASYYVKYPRDAVMAVTLRPDGTPGLLCHICASGVF